VHAGEVVDALHGIPREVPPQVVGKELGVVIAAIVDKERRNALNPITLILPHGIETGGKAALIEHALGQVD
jgi:hypothetical protein